MSKGFNITRGDGINGADHYYWNGLSGFFRGPDDYIVNAKYDIHFLLHELLYKRRHPIQSAFRIAAFKNDILSLDIAQIPQACLVGFVSRRRSIRFANGKDNADFRRALSCLLSSRWNFQRQEQH